jgi:hypothetical protein
MMHPDATKYTLSPEDANLLAVMSGMPPSARVEFMKKHKRKHGMAGLYDLFNQFISLANSVIENNRAQVESALIQQFKITPEDARRLNLPSILAAAAIGVEISTAVNPAGCCGECAFRQGTVANQCISTVHDAKMAKQNGTDFMCHRNLDGSGNPKGLCVGFKKFAGREGEPE